MNDTGQARDAAPRHRGNRLGFLIFRAAVRLFGLKGAYGLLYLVCLHYLVFDRAAVAAALAYVTRRFPGAPRFRQLARVYRLFVEQGKSLIDRHYLVSGLGVFDIDFRDAATLAALAGDPRRGFVLLTSHVGNWQALMTTLAALRRPVYLHMRPEENPAVRESLNLNDADRLVRFVSPAQFLGGVVELTRRLQEGSVVSVMGDRAYGARTVEVTFLGRPAHFPCGAFAVAAAVGCPVAVLFSAKIGVRQYRVDLPAVFRPAYRDGAARDDQLREWVQDYARLLEAHLNEFPFQCFLFHDAWTAPADARA